MKRNIQYIYSVHEDGASQPPPHQSVASRSRRAKLAEVVDGRRLNELGMEAHSSILQLNSNQFLIFIAMDLLFARINGFRTQGREELRSKSSYFSLVH